MSYPYLAHLLGAYLHQDYLVVSGSEEGAIDDFLALEPPYFGWGLRADLERFLDDHARAPLAALEATFPGAIYVGEDDAAARAWVGQVLARVAAKVG